MYGRRAAELLDAVKVEFGEVAVEINADKPRRNSFEINLVKGDGTGNLDFQY